MHPLVLFDIDYTLFDTGAFKQSGLTAYKIYEEVEGILRELQEVATLGIFSEGEKSFQEKKLKESLIDTFFPKEHVHIFAEKISELPKVLDQYKANKLFLVDDKLTALYKAKEYVPSVFTIWVKRGEYAKYQKPIDGFKPDAIIADLKELGKIVKSN